jgi:tetratricopeptide (TPR) repeat protein
VARSQSNARLAIQLLANELREIAATDGDLVHADETSITVRSMRKIGFVCNADDADAMNIIDVWVLGDGFTAGASVDSLLVLLNHDVELSSDDEWVAALLDYEDDVSARSMRCESWPRSRLTGGTAGDYPIQRLEVDTDIDISDVAVGSPVRSFEYNTYALQEIDGAWSLTRQSGPDGRTVTLVEDLAPSDESGLLFAYADTAGHDLTLAQAAANPGSIGRISLIVTAREAGPTLALNADGYHEDLLSTSVFLRNNRIAQVDPPAAAVTEGSGGSGGDDGGGDAVDPGGGDDGDDDYEWSQPDEDDPWEEGDNGRWWDYDADEWGYDDGWGRGHWYDETGWTDEDGYRRLWDHDDAYHIAKSAKKEAEEAEKASKKTAKEAEKAIRYADKAMEEYEKALEEYDNGDLDKAEDHLEKAWEKLEKARDKNLADAQEEFLEARRRAANAQDLLAAAYDALNGATDEHDREKAEKRIQEAEEKLDKALQELDDATEAIEQAEARIEEVENTLSNPPWS